jgi:hypothetical protein
LSFRGNYSYWTNQLVQYRYLMQLIAQEDYIKFSILSSKDAIVRNQVLLQV